MLLSDLRPPGDRWGGSSERVCRGRMPAFSRLHIALNQPVSGVKIRL
jgi:hypothetical protein